MAKNNLVPTAGGNALPKLIATLAVLALLVVIVKYPGDAATFVQGVLGTAEGAVDGVAAFFRTLTT